MKGACQMGKTPLPLGCNPLPNIQRGAWGPMYQRKWYCPLGFSNCLACKSSFRDCCFFLILSSASCAMSDLVITCCMEHSVISVLPAQQYHPSEKGTPQYLTITNCKIGRVSIRPGRQLCYFADSEQPCLSIPPSQMLPYSKGAYHEDTTYTYQGIIPI